MNPAPRPSRPHPPQRLQRRRRRPEIRPATCAASGAVLFCENQGLFKTTFSVEFCTADRFASAGCTVSELYLVPHPFAALSFSAGITCEKDPSLFWPEAFLPRSR